MSYNPFDNVTLRPEDLASVLSARQNNMLAQTGFNQIQSIGAPQSGPDSGVSNLGGALARALFQPKAISNLQGAQSNFGQALGDALARGTPGTVSSTLVTPQTPATFIPVQSQPLPPVGQAPAMGPYTSNVPMAGDKSGGSSSGGGGGLGGLASMAGAAAGGGGSAPSSGGGGMMSMLGGMGGGSGGGSSSQDSQYTPPPPTFGNNARAPQLASAAGTSGGYSIGQQAVHPQTGQKLTFTGTAWA